MPGMGMKEYEREMRRLTEEMSRYSERMVMKMASTIDMSMLSGFLPINREQEIEKVDNLRDETVLPLLDRVYDLKRISEDPTELAIKLKEEFKAKGIVFNCKVALVPGTALFDVFPQDAQSYLIWCAFTQHNPNSRF